MISEIDRSIDQIIWHVKHPLEILENIVSITSFYMYLAKMTPYFKISSILDPPYCMSKSFSEISETPFENMNAIEELMFFLRDFFLYTPMYM